MPNEDRSVYNIVTLRNIDDEDFVFMVDKVEYVIPRGQTRNFPKFMAALAVKHLTDKLLMKEDTSGLSLMNETMRQEMAAKIVLNELNYEKPAAPTDKEIVDDINKPTDLDLALNKNKGRLKENEQLIPTPAVSVKEDEVLVEPEETFEGLKTPKGLPSREKMMDYAKSTLGIDFDTIIKAPGKNKGKTIRDVYVGMSDQELYNEFQLEGVEL